MKEENGGDEENGGEENVEERKAAQSFVSFSADINVSGMSEDAVSGYLMHAAIALALWRGCPLES